MKVAELVPQPLWKESFGRAHAKFVSDQAGCYALTTFDTDILYVGLATILRRRFLQHLDTAEKIATSVQGRAIWFFWLECDELEVVERTWMNAHLLKHAKLPILNSIYSPTKF